ncbi:MAG: hypothetical protein IPJ46_12845 [Anaerolineales bacterium]|nr:hypothetical protein [Anaerolineales bacterium]
MDKRILTVLILSIIFLAVAFMGGDPPSARGFYYMIWLAFIWLLWKRRGPLKTWLQSRTLPDLFLFVGVGLIMIIIEETIAGITVHLLSVKSPSELPALITQYYANNPLLLPGFIIAWYILFKRYEYSLTGGIYPGRALWIVLREDLYSCPHHPHHGNSVASSNNVHVHRNHPAVGPIAADTWHPQTEERDPLFYRSDLSHRYVNALCFHSYFSHKCRMA